MGLREYAWNREELSSNVYAGKYSTHDDVNRNSVIRQLEPEHVDLELGEHTLEYNGRRMDVELVVNKRWAAFFYDETFEDELGDQEFEEVITHFLTPVQYRQQSGLPGV